MSELFDIYDKSIDADPFAAYGIIRESQPCYWSDNAQMWVLTRYHDVLHAAQDWRVFSSAQGNLIDEIEGRSGNTLGTTDPPRHSRLRSLANAAFAKKNIGHLSQPTLEIANQQLDGIVGKSSFDFVDEFSSQITVKILFKMLGLPALDPCEVRKRVVLAISTDKSVCGRGPRNDAAFTELTRFLSKEITHRRESPSDDFITHLAEVEIDGERLSAQEVILITTMLVIAGVESLSSFLTMLCLNLAQFPDQRKLISSDLALLPQAIEESLRYNTSAQRFRRVLTCDVELHGQTMKKGDKVALAYGAANRDWRKFPQPDTYDITRNTAGHLGFGSGVHYCLGVALARMVAEISMQQFLSRCPDFSVESEALHWISSSNFRSPRNLVLTAKQ